MEKYDKLHGLNVNKNRETKIYEIKKKRDYKKVDNKKKERNENKGKIIK